MLEWAEDDGGARARTPAGCWRRGTRSATPADTAIDTSPGRSTGSVSDCNASPRQHIRIRHHQQRRGQHSHPCAERYRCNDNTRAASRPPSGMPRTVWDV